MSNFYGNGGYYQGADPNYYGVEGAYGGGLYNTGNRDVDQFAANYSYFDPVSSFVNGGVFGFGRSNAPNYAAGTNPSDPRWGGGASSNGRPLGLLGDGNYFNSWERYDPDAVDFSMYGLTAQGAPGYETNMEAQRDASMARSMGWFEPNADGTLPTMQEAMRRREASTKQFQGAQLGAINRGYGEASGLLANLGTKANRDISDSSKRANAANVQSMQNAGMNNSTIGSQLRRGVAQDSARQRADVSEGVSAARSGLAVDYGKALSAQYGSMGAAEQSFGAQEQANAGSLIGGIYNDQIQQAGGGGGGNDWAQLIPLFLAML
jgi:hypothetical protein